MDQKSISDLDSSPTQFTVTGPPIKIARTDASTLTEIMMKRPWENTRPATQSFFNLVHIESEFLTFK